MHRTIAGVGRGRRAALHVLLGLLLSLLLSLLLGCSSCDDVSLPGLGRDEPSPPSSPTETVFEHTGEMRDSAARVGAARFQSFDIDVVANDSLVITVSSSAFDPVLHVTLPGETTALINDDWQGSREHAQLVVLVPRSGAMKVGVTSYDEEARGLYRLLIRRPTAQSQDGRDSIVLAPGQSHEGELVQGDATTPDGRFLDQVLVHAPGGRAHVTVTGLASMTPSAVLLDPRGHALAADSSGGFALDDGGVHRLQVMGPSPGAGGRYRVALTASGAASGGAIARSHHQLPTAGTAAQPVQIGQSVRGTLAENDARLPTGETADVYELVVDRAGQEVSVELTSTGFDSYLIVVGPGGELWENDDVGGSLDAALRLTLPATGTYRIVASSYRAGERGDYELKVTPDSRPLDGGVASATPTGAQTLRGALTSSDAQLQTGEHYDTHELTLAAGQAVTLSLRSSEFDTYLIIRPPTGPQQDNDDAEPGNTNSYLSFVATTAGTHRVQVTSFRAGETGTYELEVTGAGDGPPIGNTAPTPAPTPAPAAPPSSATDIRGTLAAGDRTLASGEYADEHPMSFTAGDPVGLRLSSTAFDPYLIVRTPSGRQLDNDDFTAGSFDSGVDIPVAEPGNYVVTVTSYRSGETGPYVLSRRRGAAVPRAGSSGAEGSGGRVFGLFAGISDYPPGVGDLPECANDAIKLAQALRENGLLTAEREIVLTDSQVTVANIRAAMTRMASQLGPDDVFVFFYSGHGGQTSSSADPREIDGRDEHLILHDGQLGDDELGRLFDGVRAGVSLVAIDACHSGGFAKDVITRPGRVGMFSSEEDVLSAVAGQFRAGGYLSHFLREGVSGQADSDPSDRVLTVGELTHYVYRQFGAHAQDIHMAATYQHLVVDRGAVRVDRVLWSYQ